MAAQTITNFLAMLKEYYTPERVENMIYADNPFFALVPKVEKFPGNDAKIPLVVANPQGRSATFTTAQSAGATSASTTKAFQLTRVLDYGVVTIDTETIEASEGQEGAFLEAKTVEIDGIINALTRSCAISLFRKGWGTVGQIGSISSATVALLTASDVHNIEVGQVHVFSSSEDSATLRGAPEKLTVVGVNRNAGTVTYNTNPSAPQANDFIFCDGDRQNSATPTRLKVSGLEDWAPASAPSSTSFFGVDRTADSRLYGVSYSGVSDDVDDALLEGANRSAVLGYKIDHFFLSYTKFSELEKKLQGQVRYIDLKGPAEVGFRGIIINGPRGPIKVIPDQNCPQNRAFGVQMDMLKLYTLGKAIRPLNADGLDMLRQSSADGIEVRYGFKGNLGCRAPASIVNVQF